MAGLIWLFQNIQNIPPVNTDRGTKPLLLIELEPPIIFVDRTTQVLQDTTTTYSDASTEYSSPTQVYGGVYGDGPYLPPLLDWIDSIVPELNSTYSQNEFVDTTTEYSSSSVEYSSSTQEYGGIDRQSATAPIFDTMDNIKPVFNTVGNL